MDLRLTALRRSSVAVLAAPLALALLATPALAGPKPTGGPAGAKDVQANSPQVAGDATSDTTARFPTVRCRFRTVALSPAGSATLGSPAVAGRVTAGSATRCSSGSGASIARSPTIPGGRLDGQSRRPDRNLGAREPCGVALWSRGSAADPTSSQTS